MWLPCSIRAAGSLIDWRSREVAESAQQILLVEEQQRHVVCRRNVVHSNDLLLLHLAHNGDLLDAGGILTAPRGGRRSTYGIPLSLDYPVDEQGNAGMLGLD